MMHEPDGIRDKVLVENIEKQLMELEVLQSIYSNTNELVIEDEEAVYDAREYLANSNANANQLLKRNLGFVIKFSTDVASDNSHYVQLQLEIICRLPTLYPLRSPPDVFVRCMSRNLNKNFSPDLSSFIKSAHENDCSILNIIEWIKENIHNYVNNNNNKDSSSDSHVTDRPVNQPDESSISPKKSISFCRMFIYSHHIYSVNKRRTIVHMAKELDLDGFSMPGKPGIICVEGEQSSTQDFWTRLKSMPWQRLQIKDTQCMSVDADQLPTVKKFDSFEEKIFSANNDSNIDIGLFFAYLKQKNLESIFNLYFGVDGKLPSTA